MVDVENPVLISRVGKSKAGNGKKAPLGSRQLVSADNHGEKTVEQRYQKKTQLEHILLRPDTYIGSTEKVTHDMWVYDEPMDKIVKRPVTYVPGLYKIFDEIIVNAADNKQRDPDMSKLKVNIDAENGMISVWNDGKGIPIQMHREHHCYVPELIFGHLLTGSNFDDDQKKTTGGRNGFGAKLANIYSTEFIIETADERAGKHYKQVFRNNMQQKDEPIIREDYDGTDFTCITFRPDWGRFHMNGMELDTIALLRKRVYDMAGCMSGYGGARMKVSLNKKRLPVSTFKEYISMYDGMEQPVIFEKISNRWEVGVAVSADNIFQQVSYVNAICTIKGGTHVECVANQVINRLLPVLKKKHKSEVKGHFIRNHLCVFVNGLVENPAFNSQSKEALTTKDTAFGSAPKLSEAGLKAVEKSEIVERVLSWAKHRQDQQLNRKSGKKSGKLTGISKLDDANHAGTAKSQNCTLILTEGDSAKTLAVSGLGVVGRDRYGVFPLKGKLLNVREATNPQVLKNEEIQNLVKIMGLKFNQVYTDTKSLRYGHLMIMTDQDHDGSHIKGLLINFVHHYWPSLLKIDGFLQEFITPIVKAFKGRQEKWFYTIPEYVTWMDNNDGGKGWRGKYYKGLGTSSPKEAKEYFAALETHQLEFEWKDDLKDADLIDMAFSKKRAEDRKDWLRGFKDGTHANYDVEAVTYESFVNNELILFSMEDNKRSIPCLMDGLKPSQRKVLFSCFKRNLKKEIKVGQLAGYVSEHSAYHHGEASLNGTIIAMAQNYTGSNNLNLLTPAGQFGTRLMGGKDAASPRYIFTCLQKAARAVFHPDDDALLHYLEDDGQSIEPEFYMPVIPLILLNGSDGIGTGWSSQVPNYSPRDVIENLRRRIRGQGFVELQPWYNGFAGTITAKPGKKLGEAGYLCKGLVQRINDTTVEITELPVRRWTQDYKQFLESLLPGAEDAKAKAAGKAGAKKVAAKSNGDADKDKSSSRCIKDFKENHTDTTVHFTITMSAEDLDAIDIGDGLYKFFKLESSLSTSNMVLFDQDAHLIKYESPQHMMEEFFNLRMEYYHRRKNSLLDKLQKEWSKLDNKVRFILAVVEERLQVNNRKKADLLDELQREGYDMFLPPKAKLNISGAEEGEENEDAPDEPSGDELSKGYDYLLSMKIWSLTLERVRMLENELEAKTKEMAELKATPPSQLWLNDLDALGVVLDEIEEAAKKQEAEDAKQRKLASKRKGGRAKGRGGHGGKNFDDDSDFEDGPKKKSSKAIKAEPTFLPTRAIVPPLMTSAGGGMVSSAFALAEAEGRIVIDAVPGQRGAKRDPVKEEVDEFGDEIVKSIKEEYGSVPDTTSIPDMESSTSRSKMPAMSLSARLKQKYSEKSEKPPSLKPQRGAAASKRSVHEVVDSDDDGLDGQLDAAAPTIVPKTSDVIKPEPSASSKPRPVSRVGRKAKAVVDLDSDEEEDDIFDSDDDKEEMPSEPAVRARSGRSAALNRKPIMDVESDEEESDVYDPAAEDIEDQEEDEYEPTPAKPVVRGRGRGATAAAKAASMRQPVAKPAARDRKGRVASQHTAETYPLSDDDEEDLPLIEDTKPAVSAKPPAKGARGKGATTVASSKAKPMNAKQTKGKTVPKSKEETDDEDARMDGEKEEDIFELDDSDDAFAAIGRGRGAKKQTKKKTQTKTKAVGKGVKRGSRNSISDEEENVFSPDKMSPPTKRKPNKATPAASRFKASKPLQDDDETSESEIEEVTKTPRPTRRTGRRQQVTYVEVESDESEEEYHCGEDDDDEYEFDA